MRIVALAFAATLTAAPVAAQDYDFNPFSGTWEREDPYQESPDPYGDEYQRRMMEEGWRTEYENTRELGRLAPCASTWNNPAAAEECRRRAGY